MPKIIAIEAHNRIGLSRPEAAQYIGVSVGTFNLMVEEGAMPAPKKYGSRLLWFRGAIEKAFGDLPEESEEQTPKNKWSECQA